jgi:cyclohexadieny/prephenate dehydrogenase
MSVSPPPFQEIAIIGGGLIGSSLARAIRQHWPALKLAMSDTDPAVIARLKALNLADKIDQNAQQCVKNADCVVLCVPVGACGAVVKTIAPALKPGAVLSDVGSVKASVIKDVMSHVPDGVHFIPAHPVAGTEYSGPDAGRADLFDKRWTIITPLEDTDPAKLDQLCKLWQALGAKIEMMSPKHHDLVLAVTSHLPHLIAYNIVGTADDLESVTQSEVIKFSAGGFRDFTRIAASDPTMWRDIFLHNKEAVLEMLGRFSEDLSLLQRAIRWDDGDTLMELFTRTRAIRRSVIDSGQDTDQADFGRS